MIKKNIKYYILIFGTLILLAINTIEITKEIYNVIKLDSSVRSDYVQTKCRATSDTESLPYECNSEYAFRVDENVYQCSYSYDSLTKKSNNKNKTVRFEKDNPTNCYVAGKYEYLIPGPILEIIFLIIFIWEIKKLKHKDK